MIEADEKYMQRCLELARHGMGKVSPNPMVGAVLVYDGKIIGEGYHRRYGEAHAEVNAIASVGDESLLKKATLYVNLEPCSHYGKTPPCAELIIRKQIPHVVVGCVDPFPEVSGRGIRMLQEAGVVVTTGVLKDEAYALNLPFMTNQLLHRPYIYLKWAQSADGFIDRLRDDASEAAVRLSSPDMLQRVHKKRSEVDAIMVGTRTALLDNPSLTVRYWAGASPVRVVLDQALVIPSHYRLFDGSVRTLVFTEKEKANRPNVEYIPIDYSTHVLNQVLAYLYSQGLHTLLVEGGASTLDSFLSSGLWDVLQVETAPLLLEDGVRAPSIPSDAILRKTSVFTDKATGRHLVNLYAPNLYYS